MEEKLTIEEVIEILIQNLKRGHDSLREKILSEPEENVLRDAWQLEVADEIICCFSRYEKVLFAHNDDLACMLAPKTSLTLLMIDYYNNVFHDMEVEQQAYSYMSQSGFSDFIDGIIDSLAESDEFLDEQEEDEGYFDIECPKCGKKVWCHGIDNYDSVVCTECHTEIVFIDDPETNDLN